MKLCACIVFTVCSCTHSIFFYFQGDANSVQVSVQLKLSNKVKNLFEYCELHLPFFHRFVLILNLAVLLLIIVIIDWAFESV